MRKTKYAYFQIANATKGSDKRFVRIEHIRFDAEWSAMCKESGRTYPFCVFNKTAGSVDDYSAVLLSQLRRVHEATEIESDWNGMLQSQPGNCQGENSAAYNEVRNELAKSWEQRYLDSQGLPLPEVHSVYRPRCS
jgi:hypothetical protein